MIEVSVLGMKRCKSHGVVGWLGSVLNGVLEELVIWEDRWLQAQIWQVRIVARSMGEWWMDSISLLVASSGEGRVV